MPPQKFAVTTLALSCVGLGIYAYSERTARLAAEDRLYTAQAENARLTTAQATPAAVLPAPALDSSALPMPLTVPSATGVTPAAAMPGPGRPGSEFAAMMESPEMQQLMNLRARGTLDGRYAALFKQLGLPPEQLQRFQQLLLDKQSTARDVMAAMRSQGLAPGRDSGEQMRTLVQNALAEIDAQIRTEIGDSAFAQYQSYEQTQPQRALLDRVQQRLSYTSQPLTEQQAAGLLQLLAASSPQTAPTVSGRFGPTGTGGSNQVPITDQTLAQARGILSSSQLAALEELQREQQAQAQLMQRTRQSQILASPAAPAPR